MLTLAKKQGKKYKKRKPSHICFQKFNNKFNEVENYHRVWDHCHYTEEFRGAAHGNCNLRHKTLKNILVVFYNGSNYDYHFIVNHFIIKEELTEELQSNLTEETNRKNHETLRASRRKYWEIQNLLSTNTKRI